MLYLDSYWQAYIYYFSFIWDVHTTQRCRLSAETKLPAVCSFVLFQFYFTLWDGLYAYLGWTGVEQGASWSRSELVLLWLHSDTSAGRFAGITLRRQARVRYEHSNRDHRHSTDTSSRSYTRRPAHRSSCHHGTWLCTYHFASVWSSAPA